MSISTNKTNFSLELMDDSNYLSTENIQSFSSFSNMRDKKNKPQNNEIKPAESIPTFSTNLLEENKKESQQELLKKISTLPEELSKVRVKYSKTQEVLKELEDRYATDIELFSQHLQKANKELESFKQKSELSNSSELQKLVNKCCEKDTELKYLKEIIVSLEQQIQKFDENVSNNDLEFYVGMHVFCKKKIDLFL